MDKENTKQFWNMVAALCAEYNQKVLKQRIKIRQKVLSFKVEEK